MKYNPCFKNKINCTNSDEVFEYFMKTLKNKITDWNYFVNWNKAIRERKKAEVNLNILNYLIGKDDIKNEALYLFRKYPESISVIPLLLACRDSEFEILTNYKKGKFEYEYFDLNRYSKITPEKAVEFFIETGLAEQISTGNIKSLVDYVFGVEVGLGSNGRKNRGGDAMENIVEFFVASLCKSQNYVYTTQATSTDIKRKWGFNVTVDKSERKIDFAINANNRLILIETNFYGGGGSKLKSTAGEYRTLQRCIKNDNHKFIWITDGAGWHTTKLPLQEAFNENDYTINLDMLEKGILGDLINVNT